MKCSCCSEQWNQLPLPLLNFKGKKAMLATYIHCNPSMQGWDACTLPIGVGGSVLGTEQGWNQTAQLPAGMHTWHSAVPGSLSYLL